MKIYFNFDLINFNSYRINAVCKKALFPETESDIIELYKSKTPFTLLGSGHNIILSKSYYNIPFVIFNGNYTNNIPIFQDM